MSSIKLLPVEILHRIFDHLDAETILLSIRPVSRLFRSIVNTYNRYALDMKLISKSNFYLICRLINPQNIISLVLSNDVRTSNQIELFISTVHLQELTRLDSLTLLGIDDCQLDIIMKHIEPSYLTSFSFSLRNYYDSSMETTTNLLSSIIEKLNLRKLECDMVYNLFSNISGSINCTIQYLTIKSRIDTVKLCHILQHCPHLHTLIVLETYHGTLDNIIPKSFPQLISLTIKTFAGTMNELELFLLLTPSLVYLKVINGNNMINGKRWEEFIQIHLPHLNRFEFFFKQWTRKDETLRDAELIIASFQTPFWIEHKKWFVIYENEHEQYIYLYLLPICETSLKYEPQFKKKSLCSCHTMKHDHPAMMNNVKSLELVLDRSLAHHIQEKKTTAKSSLFPKVTEVTIQIEDGWPLFSMQLLSMFIDFSKIVKLVWNDPLDDRRIQQILIQLEVFLEQTKSLLSLSIQNNDNKSSQTIDNLCLIIPRSVKHLRIPVRKLKHVKQLLRRCESLCTIEFDCKTSKLSKEVVEWFGNNSFNSTCHRTYTSAHVWLGKITLQ